MQERKDDEATQKLLEESAPRKRKAPPANERDQRAAKKQAREKTREQVADEPSPRAKDREPDPTSPLSSQELRNLINGYLRYGALEDRGDEVLRDAKLEHRDASVVRAALDEVVAISQQKADDAQKKIAAVERESRKTVAKKDKKAILFEWKEVKRINAETILERPGDMRFLRATVDHASNAHAFRVHGNVKPPSYNVSWGAREDGMLCVGIARHGFGAWAAIRDDAELGMSDKFFLEEQRVDRKEERSRAEDKNAKLPGPVHLVRRANYLLGLMKEHAASKAEAKRTQENPRNHRRLGRVEKGASVAASPVPAGHRARDSERPGARPLSRGNARKGRAHGEGASGAQRQATPQRACAEGVGSPLAQRPCPRVERGPGRGRFGAGRRGHRSDEASARSRRRRCMLRAEAAAGAGPPRAAAQHDDEELGVEAALRQRAQGRADCRRQLHLLAQPARQPGRRATLVSDALEVEAG